MKLRLSVLNNKHFLALAGNVVISGFSVLQMALLYRSMNLTDVGIWFYFLVILGIGESLRNGLLSTATIKFYAGSEEKRGAAVLGSVWLLALIITVLLCMFNLCFIPFLHQVNDKSLVICIKWFGVTFISSLPYTLISWILMAEERYDKILALRLVNSGSMIVSLFIWILMKKMNLESLMWINFLTNMLTNIVGFFWGMARIKTIFSLTKECVYEIYHFGKFSLATTISSYMLRSVDSFIIKFMLGAAGPAALAIYNIPVKLLEIVEIPLRSFAGTAMSAMATAYNNKNLDQTAYIFKKYSGMLTMAFVIIFFFVLFLAQIPVDLLAGKKNMSPADSLMAANVFRILIFYAIFAPIDRFNGVTLDIIHKPKINFYKVLLMLAVNIAADFLGLAIFKDIYGVVYGYFFTLITGLIFGYFQLRKYIKYTITDIFSLGYTELRLLIEKKLK